MFRPLLYPPNRVEEGRLAVYSAPEQPELPSRPHHTRRLQRLKFIPELLPLDVQLMAFSFLGRQGRDRLLQLNTQTLPFGFSCTQGSSDVLQRVMQDRRTPEAG